MDAALHAAITAVHLADDGTAQRWFELVRTTYEQLRDAGTPDWDSYTSALAENAGPAGVDRWTVEAFVEHLTAHDVAPIETVERMAELGADLPAHHAELTAAAAEPSAAAEPESTEDDPAAWAAFLAENGPRWDGRDESWEQFRAWFLYEAEQRGAGPSATGFVTYAEAQPDKVAVFAQYGVTITAPAASSEQAPAPDVSAYPEVKPGDSGEWVDYLDAMLTSHGF